MKFVKENIPLISAMLIFLGYWNLTLYYEFFQIDIYQYVSTTEVILSFLPLIKSTIVISIVVLLFFFIFFGKSIFFRKPRKKETGDEKLIKTNKFKNDWKLKTDIKMLFSKKSYQKNPFQNTIIFLGNFLEIISKIGFIIFLAASVGTIYYAAYFKNTILLNNFYIILSFAVFAILVAAMFIDEFIIQSLQIPLKEKLGKYLSPTLILIVVFFINYSLNVRNATKVLNNKSNLKVVAVTKTATYTTSDTVALIGQTQSYIFLRNLRANTNIIIPKTELVTIQMGKE